MLLSTISTFRHRSLCKLPCMSLLSALWKHRVSNKLSSISLSYFHFGDSYVNCHAYISPIHSGDTEFYVSYYPYFSHLHCEDICSSVSYHTYLSSHLHCGDIYFSCKLTCRPVTTGVSDDPPPPPKMAKFNAIAR